MLKGLAQQNQGPVEVLKPLLPTNVLGHGWSRI